MPGADSAAEDLARRIKGEIMEKEHLTCSIGIGPSRIVAKIASDFRKPDGLTVVNPDQVEEFLAPLPVGKIPGIGRKTGGELGQMGFPDHRGSHAFGCPAPAVPFRQVGAFHA